MLFECQLIVFQAYRDFVGNERGWFANKFRIKPVPHPAQLSLGVRVASKLRDLLPRQSALIDNRNAIHDSQESLNVSRRIIEITAFARVIHWRALYSMGIR